MEAVYRWNYSFVQMQVEKNASKTIGNSFWRFWIMVNSPD